MLNITQGRHCIILINFNLTRANSFSFSRRATHLFPRHFQVNVRLGNFNFFKLCVICVSLCSTGPLNKHGRLVLWWKRGLRLSGPVDTKSIGVVKAGGWPWNHKTSRTEIWIFWQLDMCTAERFVRFCFIVFVLFFRLFVMIAYKFNINLRILKFINS